MEKYGTEDLEKIIFFVVEAANVAERLEKEKNWIAKATAVLPLTDEFISLLSINFKEVPKQAADLSEEERTKLLAAASEKYDIADDAKEALIEEGLKMADQVVSVVSTISTYAKKWKKK